MIINPYRLTTYRAEVLADSPVAYWRLGEASGTTAADETGSYAGTYVGSPTLGVAGAVAGDDAITLNGSSQYLNGTTLGTLGSNLGDGLTVEAWIKTTNTADIDTLFGFANAGSTTAFFIRKNSTSTGVVANRFRCFLRGEGNIIRAGDTAAISISDGTWHHVVCTVTGAEFKFYVDSTEYAFSYDVTSAPTSFANLAVAMGVGALNNNGSLVRHFNGSMDEVAIYNSVLSPTRIAAHYDARTRA